MSKYYCLIAGLPEINIDDQKLTYSVESFKEEVYEQLSLSDKKLFDLFFLKYDNENLLHFLKDKDAQVNALGNISAEDLEIVVKSLRDDENMSKGFVAPYFKEFISWQGSEKSLETQSILEPDYLSALYYDYAMKSSNSFVSQWYEFNMNLNNLLIASLGRKYGFEVQNFIVGNNNVSMALRSSAARDWGLSGEIDYIEQVQRIAEETDTTEKERKIDLLKWNWLEENTFFNYFTVEKVFAYMLKLEIIERWYVLNREEGEKILREMISRLKSEVKMPEEL